MRNIDKIIIHCSAVRPRQTSSARQIDAWHKARGYRCIGYHYVVRRDGSIERGRPDHMTGAHCLGHNMGSIGICYEGGVDADGHPADTRTEAQRATLLSLLRELKAIYPDARIRSHHDLTHARPAPASMQLVNTVIFRLGVIIYLPTD